jgi:hypothetical protein
MAILVIGGMLILTSAVGADQLGGNRGVASARCRPGSTSTTSSLNARRRRANPVKNPVILPVRERGPLGHCEDIRFTSSGTRGNGR